VRAGLPRPEFGSRTHRANRPTVVFADIHPPVSGCNCDLALGVMGQWRGGMPSRAHYERPVGSGAVRRFPHATGPLPLGCTAALKSPPRRGGSRAPQATRETGWVTGLHVHHNSGNQEWSV
jgi:hypothetical protein